MRVNNDLSHVSTEDVHVDVMIRFFILFISSLLSNFDGIVGSRSFRLHKNYIISEHNSIALCATEKYLSSGRGFRDTPSQY